MAHENSHKIIASPPRQPSAGKASFPGFAPPTSNTTYTPNQFFDVVLPNASRGCVRIVAYLLRKTLGWCDALGNPQHEQIAVSNSELERRAGVGHDMIRSALDEAVGMHFIQCVHAGRARSAGDAGETAVYALKWDATPCYARSLDDFRGFFEGEGNRTDIPNQFFDALIPSETIAVTKVVGAVIRYSIGFVAARGHRRQQATLAYSQILKVAGLSSRRTLASAIREAVAKKYIVRLDPGYFSARPSERRSAIYAVCWSDDFHLAIDAETGAITPKRIPIGVGITPPEKDTSGSLEPSDPATSNPPKRIPADHSEKDTIETKQLNEKEKQSGEAAEALKKEGFDERTASRIAAQFSTSVIRQQLKWLPRRRATRNRLGLLREAIEQNWPAPPGSSAETPALNVVRSAPRESAGELPEYQAWLLRQEAELRRDSPGDYQRFLTKRARSRADVAAEKSPVLRDFLLGIHDSETRRLADLRRFMSLPDRHRWETEFNNQSSNPQL